MAVGCQLSARVYFLGAALFLSGASSLQAQTRYLDLSKVADLGPGDSFDGETTDVEDPEGKNGLSKIPPGSQTFRGVPFHILDPSRNNGRSFLALKGRKKPDFPEAVSIPAGEFKASNLYFLHTCRWGGTAPDVTVAEYDVVYDDGGVEIIPLRVGVEFTNFFGADDTSASFLGWWRKYKNIEMGVSLFPWKNPRPDQPIEAILFKSRSKMPVPILFAITASDHEIPISRDSPKPEKIFKTDTTGWIPFTPSSKSPVGTAIDMSSFLDAPAGKHGKVKADGDKLVFEDGTPAKFWGMKLSNGWEKWDRKVLEDVLDRLAGMGCNLIDLSLPIRGGKFPADILEVIGKAKIRGIYCFVPRTGIPEASGDPGVLDLGFNAPTFDLFSHGPWVKLPFEFENDPQVMKPETGEIAELIGQHSLWGTSVNYWIGPWPNEYIAEYPILMATYSAFQGWPVMIGKSYSGLDWGKGMSFDDDLGNLPSLLVQWPASSLAYLRGDAQEGKIYVLKLDPHGDGFDFDPAQLQEQAFHSLAHHSGIAGGNAKTDESGKLKAKVNVAQKSIVTDSGQITWQGNVGVVKVEAPRFQALIGFLGHRKFNNPTWAVETPNSFASLSLISLTKGNITLSDHLLITGVTRMENTGQTYNAAKTKLLDAGTAPILVEPLSAKFVLYRLKADPKLRVRGLDANGQPLPTKVSAKWVKNNLVFSWVPSAFYLEVYKQ